jgi:hypothetical protein
MISYGWPLFIPKPFSYIPSVYQVCSQAYDMQPSKDGGVFGLYHKGRIARYLSPLTIKVVIAEGHHQGYYPFRIPSVFAGL